MAKRRNADAGRVIVKARQPLANENRGRHLRDAALFILLALSVLVCYLPAINGTPVWDDATHITRPAIRSATGLWRIWFEIGATDQYYPFLHSAFWLERQLWGENWAGYHLVNVALHCVSALLLVFILRRLRIPGAWLAAFIFALHPVSVESVAWMSEQKNVLSGVCYLGAALVYLHFDESRRWRTYAFASLLFLLAMLSKTVAVTLPAALLVVFWWLRGRIALKRDVLPMLPWLAVGIPLGLITAWMEHAIIGARGADFSFTIAQRFLIAGRVIWFYLAKLFWPANLAFIYPRWNVDASVWWWYLFPLGAVALAIALAAYARKRRGPLAGYLYFAGTLFPALGFVNVYPFIFSFVADHFQYMARLGIIVPVAAGLTIAAARVPDRFKWAPAAAAAAVLAVFGFLSWQHSAIFKDADIHYIAILERNPECWMAHNNLGSDLLDVGRIDEAKAHIDEALRLKPDLAVAHYNRGRILAMSPERLNEAIAEFRNAIRLKPDMAGAHDNLGMTLGRVGRVDEAIEEHRTAVRLGPEFPRFRNNLGTQLAIAGRIAEAIPEFQAAIQLEPAHAEAHNNLGLALVKTGRTEEAVSEFQTALQLRPDYPQARQNLEAALAHLGRR